MRTLIDPDDLIAAGAVFRKHEKGQIIFHEGAPSEYYHQIISGSVTVVNRNENGSEFIQGIYREGDCFGTSAVIVSQHYPATAIATLDTVIIRLSRDAFLSMLKVQPDMLLDITILLCGELRQKSLLNKSLAIQSPEDRVITLMQMLKDDSGCSKELPYRLCVSRQQIADMIGLRVETVIRAIKRLEGKGLVMIEHGKVYY